MVVKRAQGQLRLRKADVDVLYSDASSVRVIFREALPAVAQQLVMRLLFGGARPFQESVLKRWCATLSALPHTAYLGILQHLQILVPQKAQATKPGPTGQLLMLHKGFQSSLASFLQGGAQKDSPTTEPFQERLLRHAVASWDVFLKQLLEPGSASGTPAALLADSLRFRDGAGLTAAGFQFVLDERQQQLWRLVIAFLKASDDSPLGPLKVVLAMGELNVGECIKLGSAPTAPEKRFLRLLTELGVLYMEVASGQDRRFRITPGALALFRRDASQMLSRSTGTASSQEVTGDAEAQGIMVESNFKVYCYTSSDLHKKLLEHFCEIDERRCQRNLVVGQLTAASVMKALSHGIRAAHMLRYLEAAAHPQQRAGEGEGASVPSNVCGQLEVQGGSPLLSLPASLLLYIKNILYIY